MAIYSKVDKTMYLVTRGKPMPKTGVTAEQMRRSPGGPAWQASDINRGISVVSVGSTSRAGK